MTFGGDASGSTDVTTALQSFLQQAPAGATACLATNGQYRVAGRVSLTNKSLTISGQGARLFNTQRFNSALLLFNGGQNIVVRNLTIEGFNPYGRTSSAHEYAWEFGMGLSMYGVSSALIENVRVLNVSGDGFYVAGSSGVTIRNSIVDGAGRNGVGITGGVRNLVIRDSTILWTGLYAVDIEPDPGDAPVDGVTVTGNSFAHYTIDSSWTPLLFAASGSAPENNIEFSNNVVTGQSLRLTVQPNGFARTNIRILNNRSDTRVAGPVMTFAGCSNLTVTGNVQPLSGGQLATVSGCTNVNISNNTIN